MIPPALTWTHLLPPDVRLDAVGAPAWFADLLPFGGGRERRAVLVAWSVDDALAQPLEDYAGLVVNGRIPRDWLESLGFGHIHRFAAVPSLQRARWFIPLDSAAAAAGGWCLHSPLRPSAHLKQSCVRVAARLRLPLWYRDVVSVALRAPAGMETLLRELFPAAKLSLALSSGSPGPQVRRKAAAVALDRRGKPLAFIKFSQSEISRALLVHEARMLRALHSLLGAGTLAPRLLFAGEVDGSYLTVQTPIPGRPAGRRFTASHRRFLKALQREATVTAAGTELVRGLAQELAARPSLPDLRAAFAQALPVLESLRVPSTIVHSDFAPWNARCVRGALSAFDWDGAIIDGIPLYDEFHYQLTTGYLLGQWTPDAGSRRLERYRVTPPAGLDGEGVRALAIVYLAHYTARLLRHGHSPDHPLVAWYRAVLQAVRAPASAAHGAAPSFQVVPAPRP